MAELQHYKLIDAQAVNIDSIKSYLDSAAQKPDQYESSLTRLFRVCTRFVSTFYIMYFLQIERIDGVPDLYIPLFLVAIQGFDSLFSLFFVPNIT